MKNNKNNNQKKSPQNPFVSLGTIFYFGKILTISMILMSLLRLFFIFTNREYIGDSETVEIVDALKKGLIFDLSISCYFMIGIGAFYIFGMIFKMFNLNKLVVGMMKGMSLFGALVIPLALVVNTYHYQHFSYHMSFSSFTNSQGGFKVIISTIIAEFPVFFILLPTLILSAFIYILYSKCLSSLVFERQGTIILNILLFIKEFLITGCLITIMVFGARGGFSQSTLNWGRASVGSNNPFINDIGLNPLFLIGKTADIERKERGKGKYDDALTLTAAEMKESIRAYIGTENDTFLSDENFVLRMTDTKKDQTDYNVVLILMESIMGDTVGALGGEPDLTPYYNKIASEGLLFTNFYSNGDRSNKGILSTLTGFPSQYGSSILKKPIAKKPFVSLSSTLKERGYSTNFIYGGDIEFDNKRAFLLANDFDNIVSKKDFPSSDQTIHWGVPDDVVYEKAANYMSGLEEPFFVEIFPLSNHSPFDVPAEFKGHDKKLHDGVAFADYAMGQFIESVKDEDWAQNTIFVFVSDHGENRRELSTEIDWKKFWNPLVLYTPGGQIEAGTNDKLGSQLNLLPTIMTFLGGEYLNSAWGKDLIDHDGEGFAYIIENKFYGVIDKDYVYSEASDIDGVLRDKSNYESTKNKEIIWRNEDVIAVYSELSRVQESEGTFGDTRTEEEKNNE